MFCSAELPKTQNLQRLCLFCIVCTASNCVLYSAFANTLEIIRSSCFSLIDQLCTTTLSPQARYANLYIYIYCVLSIACGLLLVAPGGLSPKLPYEMCCATCVTSSAGLGTQSAELSFNMEENASARQQR